MRNFIWVLRIQKLARRSLEEICTPNIHNEHVVSSSGGGGSKNLFLNRGIKKHILEKGVSIVLTISKTEGSNCI